jgi:hypothetical protein
MALSLLARQDQASPVDAQVHDFAVLVRALEHAVATNNRGKIHELLKPNAQGDDDFGAKLREFLWLLMGLPVDHPQAVPGAALRERGRAAWAEARVRQLR